MIAEKRNSKKEIELFFRDRQKIKERKSKDKRQKVPKDITWNIGHYLIIRFTNKNNFNKLLIIILEIFISKTLRSLIDNVQINLSH